ncbi:D-ribose pyranase [Cellulomonas hominis]
MKRRGILNAELSRGLARLGHGHQVVIADCGLPLPRGADVIDLALVAGVPTFCQVLDAILAEIVVECSLAASESQGSVVADWLSARGLRPDLVPHEHFKELLPTAALIVRTGEATSWANVALRCGVPF